jgi:hypothetical protein
MEQQQQPKVAPVTNPTVDIGEILAYLVGETGVVQQSMGGFKIKVFHLRGFPWDDVFKALLYRDFRVYLTRHKADIFIEATP